MNKEILKYYYEEGKKFGYALARGATDLPSVQTFDELYTAQLQQHSVMQAEGSDGEVDWDKNVKPKPTAEYKLKVISVQKSEGAAVASEGEPKAVCGDCGVTLTLVRPGKYQCDNIVCISNQ